jgi:serine protease Do
MMLRTIGGLLLLAGALASQQGVDPDEFLKLEPVLQAAIAKAAPFVVTIETFGGSRPAHGGDKPIDEIAQSEPPGPKPQPPDKPPDPKAPKPPAPKRPPPLVPPGFLQAQGRTSGVVLTSDGWILLSRFALAINPTTILVRLADGRTFHAERGGEDTSRGIAVVKIEATGLPVPEFVDPAQVKVGQWAFALGRTFGLQEPTVHIGIVSALRRQFGRAVQIDAYTSPVNYGGAVIDVRGRVIGIAVPLSPAGRDAGVEWYDSGIGFAATIADIPDILDRMKQGNVLNRGWLGISMSSRFLGPGAQLDNVPKGGVAQQAGLQKGDVILEVDSVPVQNQFHLQMLVSSRMGGDPVHLKVQKKDAAEPVSMTLLLADAPFEERKEATGVEPPPSFPLPGKGNGR